MDQPQRPPRVDERRQEEHAERQPDPPAVGLARDRARVAAGELGVDLGPGPLLDARMPPRRRSPPAPTSLPSRIEVVDLPLPREAGAGPGSGLEATHRSARV